MFSLIMLFSLIFSLLWAQNMDHKSGVAPGYVRYEIQGGVQIRPVEILGSLNPPQVVMGGKKLKLKQLASEKENAGVFVNGEKVKTSGRVGSFYKQLKGENLLRNKNKVVIHTSSQSFEVDLPYERLFFEQPIKKVLYFSQDDMAKSWDWSDAVPENVNLVVGKTTLEKNDFNELNLPLPLNLGKQSLVVNVIKGEQKRSVVIPYTVTKIEFDSKKFYFSLLCEIEKPCDIPWDLSFSGDEVRGITNPGQTLKINNKPVEVSQGGQFTTKIDPQCLLTDSGTLQFDLGGPFGNKQIKKSWQSRDCKKWKEKGQSRFYFSFGFGHYGIVDSPAQDVKTMYSDRVMIRPRLGVGARVYDKYYVDLRVASIDEFVSSDRQHNLDNLDFNALSIGYPYRGRWFGALGFAVYKPNYWRRDDPNFFGSQSQWAAALFVEGGHRYYLSPSWTLNSRIMFSPQFFSFQNDPWRKWPFLLIEPIALEYHFL